MVRWIRSKSMPPWLRMSPLGSCFCQLRRAADDATHAGLTDEEVVCLLGEHELAGAGERVEAGLGQGGELVLAVAVREHGEGEEAQPVVAGLVEGAQDAGLVLVARAALEQLLGLVTSVAAEVLVQQVDHGPQVAALFDVDLEEVAHVVEGGRGVAQHALLLDRGRLGVALGDDDAAQCVAVLTGHFVPRLLAGVVTTADDRLLLLAGVQEDAPAVVGHLDVVVVSPTRVVDADRGTQEDGLVLEVGRTHLVPPLEVVGQPFLQGATQLGVVGEANVVRDLGVEVDGVAQLHVWVLEG